LSNTNENVTGTNTDSYPQSKPDPSLSRLKCETCPNPKSKHSFDRFCGNPIDASSFHNSKLNNLTNVFGVYQKVQEILCR